MRSVLIDGGSREGVVRGQAAMSGAGLVGRVTEVGDRAGTFLEREEFEEAMSELARLRRPVDDFFDKVTVNTEDAALRENRLRLLSRIRATLNRVADFSQIEG